MFFCSPDDSCCLGIPSAEASIRRLVESAKYLTLAFTFCAIDVREYALRLASRRVAVGSRSDSRTRSSPPTSTLSDTDFGAENVSSHPARCSALVTVLTEFAVVGSRNLMTDKLFSGVRMLAFAQPREVLSLNRAGEIPLLCGPVLPFAVALLITAPVVLFGQSLQVPNCP
jgi:hypothetical protein